jgi:hypothetical protein
MADIFTFTDKQLEQFAKDLARVMRQLDRQIVSIVNGAQTATDVFNATAILNSRPAMLQALQEAGYTELTTEFVSEYTAVPNLAKQAFAGRDLPAPSFSTVNKETMLQIARADLEGFASIGTKAMDDLRLGLYKQAVGGQPFAQLVETIRASTVGTTAAGSPLSNYSYTHANTAMLDFNGEVVRMAGESIGFDSDDSLWIVVGPDDDKTREVCEEALADPIRTKAEWQDAGYWGGTPGGWNCRHQLFPYEGAIT